MKTVLTNPKMIAQGAPRVIHNDHELGVYTDALFQLTSLENPSHAEAEAIELLTCLWIAISNRTIPFPERMRSRFLGSSSITKALLNVI
jgi:HTH-type transcriptional regulator / antitoxin HigA